MWYNFTLGAVCYLLMEYIAAEMKKSHLFLLVLAAVIALSSAYSLAAINQTYKIDYEWYSKYNEKYTDIKRYTSEDRWSLSHYPDDMEFNIVNSIGKANFLMMRYGTHLTWGLSDVDFDKYIIIYCKLGRAYSPEFRIRVGDIAQRGNTIEVKVSVNSAEKSEMADVELENVYYPYDIIRIKKSSLASKGRLCFVFKNQHGQRLYEEYCDIK